MLVGRGVIVNAGGWELEKGGVTEEIGGWAAYQVSDSEGQQAYMPILGIGTDIVETRRIQEMMEKGDGFARRVFTSRELEYSLSKRSKYLSLAARFAAKEAVAKALGQSFSWQDVEMTNALSGKPVVTLHGRAKEVAGSARVHVSVSHTRNYASAVAVVEAAG